MDILKFGETDENKNDVIHSCPMCRTEITTSTFERNLDDIIAKKANLIPMLIEKSDWTTRRNDYKVYVIEQNAKEKEEQHESDNFLKRIIDIAIPIIASLLLVIVIIIRKR